MKRIIDYYLLQWKHNDYNRKSLLLRGARQIGKTFAVRQLGATYESFVEVNLEFQPHFHAIFQTTFDPHQIIKHLSDKLQQPIIPGKTLLFIDEIQVVPQVITALRYFHEMMPELHVIAAGSLIDFAIELIGLPVGRVEILYMRPLSFVEFLAATKQHELVNVILHHRADKEVDTSLHAHYLRQVSIYLAVGGMPEAVQGWLDQKSPKVIAKIHKTILNSYQQDLNKYAKDHQILYIEKIFTQVPVQLGHKFKYNLIDGDYRKRELMPAVDLLITAGITQKVYYSAGQGLPLGGQRSDLDFKLIFLDTGLAQTSLGNNLALWFEHQEEQFVNQGALIEAFVGQELAVYACPNFKNDLYYWHKDSPPQAEIDYLIDINYQVVPVECKAGSGSTLHSLNYFLDHHKKSSYGIKFSTNNYSVFQRIHSYPLYAIAQPIIIHDEEMKEAIIALLP